jgi:hypothetical protein
MLPLFRRRLTLAKYEPIVFKQDRILLESCQDNLVPEFIEQNTRADRCTTLARDIIFGLINGREWEALRSKLKDEVVESNW